MIRSRSPETVRRHSGVTILEVLVSVGLAMLLLALLLPALQQPREIARRTACARQLGQHTKAALMYASDNADRWPFVWPRHRAPVPTLGGLMPPGLAGDWYLAAGGLWHIPMIDAYGGDYFHRSLLCPATRAERVEQQEHAVRTRGLERDRVKGTLDYEMSMAMYLDVAALNPVAPSLEPRFYIGQRVTDVTFPSSKAAIFETLPVHEAEFVRTRTLLFPNSRNMSSVDGSVKWRSTASMTAAAVPRQLIPPGRGMESLAAEAYKGNLTPRGVAGMDW